MNTEEVRLLAFKIHKECGSVYGNETETMDYSVHLNMVHSFFEKYKHYIKKENIEEVEKAIWFHDIMEEGHHSYNDVVKLIGLKSADIVANVTDEFGKSRKEKMLKTLPKTASTYESIFVKLCDRLANITFSLQEKNKNLSSNKYDMYVSEYQIFRFFLKKKDWFKDMWNELDGLVNFIDAHNISLVMNEINIIIKKRKEFYDLYQESYDENTYKYKMEEPKEIDSLGNEVRNIILKNKEMLPIDFIIESLTQLGEAPNILYDDNGFFAVTADAFQDVSFQDDPIDMNMTLFISKDKWKKTMREALIHYLTEDDVTEDDDE
jgi:hypothetical protein